MNYQSTLPTQQQVQTWQATQQVQQKSRSRMTDSFRFVMGLMDSDSYSFSPSLKRDDSDITHLTRTWRDDFYQDDFNHV